MTDSTTPQSIQKPNASGEKKESAFLNILLNVIAPMLILTKLSKPEALGPVYSLILAISLPISYGLYDYITRKKMNIFSIIGLVSTLLTGVIGLMQLNRNWLIVKETAVPGLFAVITLIGKNKKWAIVPTFLGQALDLDKIKQGFVENQKEEDYTKFIDFTTFSLAGSFVLSAVLNFILAYIILEGEPGSQLFNESIGKMTGLSFPVIVLPMMVVMGFVFMKMFKMIKDHAGLEIEDVIKK
ncbi:MAG: VC0807 family protein [Bacteriovoracaceae bacterium]